MRSAEVVVSNEDVVRAELATGFPQTWQTGRESRSVTLSNIKYCSGRGCRTIRVLAARAGGDTATDQLACL